MTALLQEIRNETRQRMEAETNLERYEELEPEVRERLEDQMEARIEGEYRAAREQMLEEMYRWFGDVLLCIEGADEKLLAYPDQSAAARQVAAGLTYPQACHNLDALEQIRDSLSRNIAETLAFEVGLLKLGAPRTRSISQYAKVIVDESKKPLHENLQSLDHRLSGRFGVSGAAEIRHAGRDAIVPVRASWPF